MKKYLAALATSVSLCAVVFSGCVEESVESEDELEHLGPPEDAESQSSLTIGQVDLKPVNDVYCQNGIGVQNVGNMTSGASSLRVKYNWNVGGFVEVYTVYYNIPSLAAGATHWVPEANDFPPPNGCLDGDNDCDFVLKADWSNAVSESNESNNSKTTSCVQIP